MTHLCGSLRRVKATNYNKAPEQAFASQLPFSIRKLCLETSVFPVWKTKISIKEPQYGSAVWCNPLYNSKHSKSTGLFWKVTQKDFYKMSHFYFLFSVATLICEGHKNNSDDLTTQLAICALTEYPSAPRWSSP